MQPGKTGSSSKIHVRVGVWGACPIILMQDRAVTSQELRTYIAIHSYQGTKEGAYPSAQQIGERAGLARRTVLTAISGLEDKGYLDIERRAGARSVYHCCIPAQPVACSGSRRGLNKDSTSGRFTAGPVPFPGTGTGAVPRHPPGAVPRHPCTDIRPRQEAMDKCGAAAQTPKGSGAADAEAPVIRAAPEEAAPFIEAVHKLWSRRRE